MWGQDWDVRQLWGCAREGKGECVEGLGGLSVHMEGGNMLVLAVGMAYVGYVRD